MVNVAGIEVGSRNTKAVILKDGKVLAYGVVSSLATPEVNARRAIETALVKANLSWDDLQYILSTGLGCDSIPFAQENKKNALLCLAKGAHWLFPSARTVFDIGAVNNFAIRIGAGGKLHDFTKGDQCAAGTGALLEAMADLLDIPLEKLCDMPASSGRKAKMSDTCVIFMEQEVISLLHAVPPTPINEIVSGIYASLASRVKGLTAAIGAEPDIAMCGGVAKSTAFVKMLEEEMGTQILIADEPQIVSSLGAAIMAYERLKGAPSLC